jgi:hypothetical protein
VLLHGTSNKPAGSFDTALIYGDYFFLEALLRLRWLPAGTTALPVTDVAASAGTASHATDGDPATVWRASGDGVWLRLDLGLSRAFKKVTVDWSGGDQRSSRFDLEVSNDGATWTRVQGGLSMGTSTRPETYTIGSYTARYLRLVGHGTTTDDTTRVAEIAVY